MKFNHDSKKGSAISVDSCLLESIYIILQRKKKKAMYPVYVLFISGTS